MEINPNEGQEIKDTDISLLDGYPINKMTYDRDFPFGPSNDSTTTRAVKPSGSEYIAIVTLNKFCAECHDSNA
ncbi:MAG: hypothetical protein N2440_04375 [Actinobacteria bacterium]|nr:hypothetical protein [Actinomycetota bacterium]